MAIVVALFAVGIFFSEYIVVPMWLSLSLAVVFLVGVIVVKGVWRNCAIALLMTMLGVVLHSASSVEEVPYGKSLDMALKITRSTISRGDYSGTEALVLDCEEPSLVGQRLMVWSDTTLRLSARDRIALRQKIRPFRKERKAYAELMYHRGFIGSISVYPSTQFELAPARFTSLHDWATERLRERLPNGDARAVVLAMVTASRSEISPALRESYSVTGASHLLAVSGLHIGIVFMLINVLLLPMLLLRYGNVARSILAVALIWLYVVLCAAPPSAMRAAIMFSFLQIALSSTHRYLSLNILASTALILLMFDTHLLFDISFQLSFLAVAGILLWAVPLYGAMKTKYRLVNALIATILVGVCSTLATLPLVSNTFGVVSFIGVLLNPVVVLLANVVVVAGVVAMLVPLPPFTYIAEVVARLQNGVVGWAEGVPYSHIHFTIPTEYMWLSYLLFVAFTLFIWSIKRKRRAEIEDY